MLNSLKVIVVKFLVKLYRLEHWDVNNEMSNHRFYVDKYGSDSIRADMFRKARSVDQSAKLFMNDYNLVAGGYNLQVFYYAMDNGSIFLVHSFIKQLRYFTLSNFK